MSDVLLSVKDLHVTFFTPMGEAKAVRGISFDIRPGEVMGLVGESGSGKTVSGFSLLRLVRAPGRITHGTVTYDGQDVLSLSEKEMENFRGRQIGMIFQNPMSCLDPVFTVGQQLTETILSHKKMPKSEAAARAVDMLSVVGISDPEKRMKQYPFELSGGMRQRVMIAMALICDPRLLIADEPTTSLDVTIQAQILDLIKEMKQRTGMSVLFITHNFGIVADICDRVLVMYGGKIVEQGTVKQVLSSAAHPYTRGLMTSVPRIDREYEKLIPIEGVPIDIMKLPKGCPFYPRCPERMEKCAERMPDFTDLGEGHTAACFKLEENHGF